MKTPLIHIKQYTLGVFLSSIVAALSYIIHWGELTLLNQAWLGSLVIAILLGTTIRSFWNMNEDWTRGINFCAKYCLEIAIVLLGASISTTTLSSIGLPLLFGIISIVFISIILSFIIGTALQLPKKMALLVACGNSICGNSAIVAVAPIIKADHKDVTSAIAFTAIIGIAMVVTLPLLAVWFNMNETAYGVFAGLTVYAVPQVIAATAPMGNVAIHMGTIVKLTRVLMLAPICFAISLLSPCLENDNKNITKQNVSIQRLIPWFIIGFIIMMVFRSFEVIPAVALPILDTTATLLTTISMAALGLNVDIRTIKKSGVRASTAVMLSLLTLGATSFTLLLILGLY